MLALVLPAWGLALLPGVFVVTNQVIFFSFFTNNLLNLFICLSFNFKESKLTYLVNELLAFVHGSC